MTSSPKPVSLTSPTSSRKSSAPKAKTASNGSKANPKAKSKTTKGGKESKSGPKSSKATTLPSPTSPPPAKQAGHKRAPHNRPGSENRNHDDPEVADGHGAAADPPHTVGDELKALNAVWFWNGLEQTYKELKKVKTFDQLWREAKECHQKELKMLEEVVSWNKKVERDHERLIAAAERGGPAVEDDYVQTYQKEVPHVQSNWDVVEYLELVTKVNEVGPPIAKSATEDWDEVIDVMSAIRPRKYTINACSAALSRLVDKFKKADGKMTSGTGHRAETELGVAVREFIEMTDEAMQELAAVDNEELDKATDEAHRTETLVGAAVSASRVSSAKQWEEGRRRPPKRSLEDPALDAVDGAEQAGDGHGGAAKRRRGGLFNDLVGAISQSNSIMGDMHSTFDQFTSALIAQGQAHADPVPSDLIERVGRLEQGQQELKQEIRDSFAKIMRAMGVDE
ncbi:hypothetical protein BCR44DRAFT_1534845 [Catenaria anguillulae PL171]|uniref:Uncharacterized protein n=1 Tax=Catenaria anguillulae PL171 TaxID=765915 RepID=A0A1Y2HJX5_9FUNG|nr:hypothetical protein BCR44DRAFT_1534845 [Catenaria anguillulae PL171]